MGGPGTTYIFKAPKRFEKARYSIEISQKKARLTPRARSTLYISVIQFSIDVLIPGLFPFDLSPVSSGPLAHYK